MTSRARRSRLMRAASRRSGFSLDATDPAGPWAAFIGRPYIWTAWSHLMHSVRTGDTAFSSVYGEGVWAYRAGFDRSLQHGVGTRNTSGVFHHADVVEHE